jgi:hypothetical protein
LLTAAACNNEEPPSDADGSGTTGTSGIVTLSNGSTGADTGTFDSSGDETGGTGGTAGVQGLNCNKIDFVFVVDNSSSMEDEQQNLVASVPGFVEAMKTALPTLQSFRVGVVDTDAYPEIGSMDPLDGCPDEADCASCDYQLGAFLNKPLSAVDPATSCAFSTGQSYMDGQAETFASEFECAAVVGVDGNPVEQQAGALVASVSPELNEAGGCNEGFLRDDALLVFLMITDEEDDHADPPAPQGGSMGEPQQWAEAIIAAKDGTAQNIVALGLIGGSPRFDDCTALNEQGQGAEQTTRLQKLMDAFETSFVGSVCADGYDAFFNDALEAVSEGCMNFIP